MKHETFHGRLEDERMLTGTGTYTTDWTFPGMAHAWFVRADRPHARILAIDTHAARAHPGVVSVLTGADMQAAGIQSIPVMNLSGSEALHIPFRPALAIDTVRFVGEAVACVVAETQQAAQDACELITIRYEDLPPVTGVMQAMAPDAPQLHANVPGNVYFDYEDGDQASTTAQFSRAANIVTHDLHISRVVANPLEPRACTGIYDAAKDLYQLYSPTQGASFMGGPMAKAMNVAPEKLEIISKDVGGSFGIRSAPYPEYCVALVAARWLGRPVRWSGTRSEVFLSDSQARDFVCHGELALDKVGRFLAMRFSMIANSGAYLSPSGVQAGTKSVTSCISGVYDLPAVHARIRLCATNMVQTSAYRGAGRPIMSTAIECLVDRAADELGLDRAELRRRNFIPKQKFPHTLVNGTTYDCGDFEGLLNDLLAAADWQGFPGRRAESARRGKLRGLGMSTHIESTMAVPAPWISHVLFQPDGTITLRTSTHSNGQGHETSFATVVARVLGVPMDILRLHTSEAGVRIAGSGTGGSKSMVCAGSSLFFSAQEVVRKGRLLAAQSLEAAVEDVEFDAGEYRIRGTDRRISLLALAKMHRGSGPNPLDTVTAHKIGSTYPAGAHIAEVEIDPETGVTEIVAYVAVDDIGNVISPELVEGQMQGGITQGAGQILGEEAVYDAQTGQLLSGSFMDYPMPRAVMVGGLKLLEHPVPTAANPLGAKGVGEAGCTGSLPTLMNAVVDALRQAGVTHFDMPATPQRVWKALQAARAGDPRAMQTHRSMPP